MNSIKKQYGLWTGIAMVVGIVIGSGVFLKAGGVLSLSGGDLRLSLLAWLVGGVIMIASGFCFAVFASRIRKYNGVIDYVEVSTNKRVGYHLAWLMTTFYYPIIASIVALFAGQYFFELIGVNVGLTDWQNFIFAFVILLLMVALNYLSPLLSARFQVSATIIKLIPIAIIAFAGFIASFVVIDGAASGNALTTPAPGYDVNFGEAVKKTAFAYEGWVCATSINAELKNSKKNLSKALTLGTIAILLFYLVYYFSLSSFLGNEGTINADANAPIKVFESIMGKIGGSIFTVFIMISCLGTVNGVAISCCRGMYTMSCRGQGICPEKFSKLGKNQSVSLLSCVYGFACMILMLVVWYLAMHGVGIFRHLGSMDEIVCAIIYGVYITMYIYIIRKFITVGFFSRFVMPTIAIIGSLFFVICGTGIYQLVFQNNIDSLISFGVFMLLFIVLMIPSLFFYNKKKENTMDLEIKA